MSLAGYNSSISICGSVDDPLPSHFVLEVVSVAGSAVLLRLLLDEIVVILDERFVPTVSVRENSGAAWVVAPVTYVEPLVGEIRINTTGLAWSGLASDVRVRDETNTTAPLYCPALVIGKARELEFTFEQATNPVEHIGAAGQRTVSGGLRTIAGSFDPIFGYSFDLPFDPEPVKDFLLYNQLLVGGDGGFVILDFAPSPSGPRLRSRIIGSGTNNQMLVSDLFSGRFSWVTSADDWTVPNPVSKARWAWTSS